MPDSQAALALWLAVAMPLASAIATDMYYTRFTVDGQGGINRINLDTMQITPVISTGLNRAYRIVIDPTQGKMYWGSTHPAAGLGGIHRANLDGTQVEQIVAGSTTSFITGMALDYENHKIVWNRSGRLFSSNLDGSGVQEFTNLGAAFIQDVAIDPLSDKILFSDWSGQSPGRLRRMNYDGSGLETIVANISNGPTGIGVDSSGGNLFWGEFVFGAGLGQIRRSTLGGGSPTMFVTGVDADTLVLDPSHEKLYWTTSNDDASLGDVRRANLDGSGVEVLPLGTLSPGGIAFIPEPASAVLLAAVGLLVFKNRGRAPLLAV